MAALGLMAGGHVHLGNVGSLFLPSNPWLYASMEGFPHMSHQDVSLRLWGDIDKNKLKPLRYIYIYYIPRGLTQKKIYITSI